MDKIIDIAILIIFLICIWSGFKKGLIMGLGGILAIIVSLIGANIISSAFSYEVIPALSPFASGYVEKQINEEVLPEMSLEGQDYSVEDLLANDPDREYEFSVKCFESVGIYSNSAERLAVKALDHANETGASVQNSVVEVLCDSITYVAGFILSFLLILIVLVVIGNIPNLSFKIPDMELLNDIGGAVTGFFTAFLLSAVLVWVLKFTGIIFGADTIKNTFIAEGFAKMDLLGRILGM